MTIKAAIVDDEKMARLNIRDALGDHLKWSVVAECANADELLSRFNRLDVDVIFLDINMPGTSGTLAAKQLVRGVKPPLIVFVTAYDDFALQAFELYAIDYLLKPFDNQRFEKTLGRIEQLLANPAEQQRQMEDYLEHKPIEKLVIKSTASVRVIKMQDVFWFGSYGNYVEVHHRQGCHLHRGSLSQLEKHVDSNLFCRVHRQAIVKVDQARELKSVSESKNCLVLSNGDEIRVSENYKSSFLKLWTRD